MKIEHIINETTTAGAVSSVAMPLGKTVKRTNETVKGLIPAEKVMKAKKKGPYANSLSESKNKVSEAELQEDDLIIIPGQGMKRKNGFIPQGKSRVDHEVEMAKSDLLAIFKNTKSVMNCIKDKTEDEGLEGWVQEKIIKASDYMNTIAEYLESKRLKEMSGGVIAAGGVGESTVEEGDLHSDFGDVVQKVKREWEAKRARERQAMSPRTVSEPSREELTARLRELESEFDPAYQYSDDYSFWTKQNAIAREIASIKKKLGSQGVAEVRIDEFYDEKSNKPEGGKIDRLVHRSLANKIPVFVLFDNKTTKSGYVQSEHPVKGFLVIGSGRKTYTTFNDETQKATKDGNRVYIQPRSMWNASRELDLDEGVAEGSSDDLVYISVDRVEAFEDWMDSEGLETNVPKTDEGTYVVYDYSNADYRSKMYASDWNEKKGVAEGFSDVVKGIKRSIKGKEHPDVVASKHAGRAIGHYNQGDIAAGDKETNRYVKTRDMHLKAKGVAEGMEQAQLSPEIIQTVQDLRKKLSRGGNLVGKLQAKKTMLVLKTDKLSQQERKLVSDTLTQAGITFKIKDNRVESIPGSWTNTLIGIPYAQGVAESTLTEKAKSTAQQKFFGMAHAMQKGKKIPGASKELKDVTKSMSKSDVTDFAKTKHKDLPSHVKKEK